MTEQPGNIEDTQTHETEQEADERYGLQQPAGLRVDVDEIHLGLRGGSLGG